MVDRSLLLGRRCFFGEAAGRGMKKCNGKIDQTETARWMTLMTGVFNNSDTWMSQEVSTWLVNGLYPTYKWPLLGLQPTY